MSRVKVLDCTLRDGGYINNWDFGEKNIKKIIWNLEESNIDVIECGFLSKSKNIDKDKSIFDSMSKVDEIIKDKHNADYVCMVNYGEYCIEDITNRNSTLVDGIRVAFHKEDLTNALSLCNEINKKGFKVYVQPMITNNYTDRELLNLVEAVNELGLYALYIVDSFGVMKKNDILRIFYILDNNLDKSIKIGFHSHNNQQLSYSNAQVLTEINSERKLIIDASVYGMGRGAGNLNTELFVEYLNNNIDAKYKIFPLLNIIDEVLLSIRSQYYWGYSLPYYLSACCNCHPDYATYLSKKNTLNIEAINKILSQIPVNRKMSFDKEYIEQLYIKYQDNNIDDKHNIKYLEELLNKRNILIVAPGSSVEKKYNYMNDFRVKEDVITVCINHYNSNIETDFLFITNMKRFDLLKDKAGIKLENIKKIVTSNIKVDDLDCIRLNYLNLINESYIINDNATLMFLNLIKTFNIKKVYLAGFDGYSYNNQKNYAEKEMIIVNSNETLENLNKEICDYLKEITKLIDIQFITPSRYNEKLIEEGENIQYVRV